MSVDFKFKTPVPYPEVLEAARRGLPGVCLCANKFDPIEEAAIPYDGDNYLHFGACREGTDTWITRFGANDPTRILQALKTQFDLEIIDQADEGFDDEEDDDDDVEDPSGQGEVSVSPDVSPA